MTVGSFFKDIGKGIVKGAEFVFADLPQALTKLITLSSDAKQIASDAAQEVITVSTDVGALVAAVGKDDGASLQAIETLIADAGTAISSKGLNFLEDAAVVGAVEQFFASINGTNYVDVLAALAQLIKDGKSMTSTVIADFKKLESDATS